MGELERQPPFRGTAWHSLLESMLAEVELEGALRAVAELTCKEVGADRATVFLIDRARNMLRGAVALGTQGRPIEVPVNFESVAGWVYLTGKPVYVADATSDLTAIDERLRHCDRIDRLLGYSTRSLCALPLRARNEVIGVLEALHPEVDRFSAEDVERLENVAAVAGLVLHVASLYEDIRVLREVERRKSEFVDLLVHEIKEPVAAIQMLADFAMEMEDDPVERRHLLERIVTRTRQVTALATELLEVSRIKRGLVLGEVRPVDLVALASTAARGMEDFAERRSVELRLELDPATPPALIDDGLAPYIFSNLLSNAIKYTDGGGTVRLCVRPETGGALIEVHDTGIGVPPGELRYLFREFYRASNARSRGVDGTGLGLVAVKEIVERYGGRTGAESTLGKGSRFWVWLPAGEASG